MKPLPLAIGLSCLSALCFTLNDTVTKFLIIRYDVTVIIFLRGLIAMAILLVLPRLLGQRAVGRTRALWLHGLRGALGLCAAWAYILGLRSLSVAEATVLVFASPLLITAASVLILREKVTPLQWGAVVSSFVGVVIAMRPDSGGLQPDALWVLLSAVLYAAIALLARWLPPEENLWQVSFYGAFFAALLVSPVALYRGFELHATDLWLFVAAAVCSSFGIGLGSIAYRMAPAKDLAPFAYSSLIWSSLLTFAFWGILPGAWTFAGMAVVAFSGVFHYLARAR